MPRIITNRSFDLRDWQGEAFRAVKEKISSNARDFLCVATPGSGKTKFALCVAHDLMIRKMCERIVIVTNTESLKQQWAEEAASFAGLDIDPDFTNAQVSETSDFHGVAITYALLGQDKRGIHAGNTFHKKTFVIFDEIHHAGESLTWGDAIKNSFQDAAFRLAISGTAFRSDDNQIPFIKYNENNTSIADYTYSYDRAIRDNVCRPVYFTMFDGQMNWKVAEQEFEHTFRDHLEPDQVSKRLRTALDPHGNWIRDVLRAADQKLTEIRRAHTNAAILVSAATQKHAKEIAKVIEEITGILPPVVVSNEGDGSEKIEAFKRSNDRWLVSVRMVSEGVDIPRLRIGVYFTIIKSELYFRQFTGRFVRVLKDLHTQDAYLFIPQDKDIVKLAEKIQEERDHALDEAERKSRSAGTGETDLFGNDYLPALKGKFVPLGAEVTDNTTISVSVGITNGAKHTIDKTKTNEDPVFIRKQRLREGLNNLAKRIALSARKGNTNIRPDWKLAHKLWIEKGGKEMDLETIDELVERQKFYESLFQRFRSNTNTHH
jgi:superfamily II DNA or RNA helicase